MIVNNILLFGKKLILQLNFVDYLLYWRSALVSWRQKFQTYFLAWTYKIKATSLFLTSLHPSDAFCPFTPSTLSTVMFSFFHMTSALAALGHPPVLHRELWHLPPPSFFSFVLSIGHSIIFSLYSSQIFAISSLYSWLNCQILLVLSNKREKNIYFVE